MDLIGATVLVTGASSGIGATTALRLARSGLRVGLTGRDLPRLTEVLARCRRHSPESRLWQADLTDEHETAAMIAEVLATFGPLDALVSNAGTPLRRQVTSLTYADLARVTRVNYLSAIQITLAVLPQMLARGRGTVVLIGSSGGRIGTPGQAAYSATKFALTGFTEVLAVELWDSPVQVRLIQPGPIDTPLRRSPDNDPPRRTGRLWPPEDVARAVELALRDDGPVERFVPPEIRDLVARHGRDLEASLVERAQDLSDEGYKPAGVPDGTGDGSRLADERQSGTN
jgi:NAD(P)-dependent dehydrogenase (short-subunit alcohol dehydrogenase family)